MEPADVLETETGRRALAICPEHGEDIPAAIRLLGIETPRPTIVTIGGAGKLDAAGMAALEPYADALVRAARTAGATMADGGTDAGVMRLVGQAHAAAGLETPLVGVVAEALACRPGEEPAGPEAPLEPHHSHFVLVPGTSWGDEAPWLSLVAGVLSGSSPSVTLLMNGGEISMRDVSESLAAGRRVLAVAGTGRAADALVDALAGSPPDARSAAFVRTGLVGAVALREDAWPSLEETVTAILLQSADGS